jgi:tetrahydromethanopterin S-methyltransferase subunit A
MANTTTDQKTTAFEIIAQQLSEAIKAKKCHTCGCLHQTVEALSGTVAGKSNLSGILSESRSAFRPKQYDCLGCPVCYPAIAANTFSEAFPEQGSGLDLCPMEEPEVRHGWPMLPGDYHVIRYNAPVAVCTLNSEVLASRLGQTAPDGLAIAGTLNTENLGIERIIRNTLANPNIRFLLVCGEDTKQAVGHLPGQSLKSLFENGIDERGRIKGAMGKRPFLKNVTAEQVHAFLGQVELVPLIGVEDELTVARAVDECRFRDPGPYQSAPLSNGVQRTEATEPRGLTLDPGGYFVVFPDRRQHRLVVEHYTNAGVLDSMIEGKTPGAICATIIERQLITRLDHAAYLGRELARAERALDTGEAYVQDRASGELDPAPIPSSCGCGSSCHSG